jgi:hypothetical protein
MRISLYASSFLFLLLGALVSAVPVRSAYSHFCDGSKHDMCGVQQVAERATGLSSVSPLRRVHNPQPS